MSTRTHLLDKITVSGLPLGEATIYEKSGARVSAKQVAEFCWGVSTFALFLLLGPFSAIATLFGIASLAKQAKGAEPEAL
ncbi:hypothetical protein ACUUL3_03340 [Thiovibrio sp. JS02]